MKRWPVIRHVRYWWLERKVERWCWQCYQVGLGLGHMNPSDRAHLDAIWRGEA